MCDMVLDWTMDKFLKDGGVPKFIERMATGMGIEEQRVNVVRVYEGSVNIQYVLDFDVDNSTGELKTDDQYLTEFYNEKYKTE